jgi:hypothetical protein
MWGSGESIFTNEDKEQAKRRYGTVKAYDIPAKKGG